MDETRWLTSDDPAAMLRVAAGRRSSCCGCLWADNGDDTLSMLPGEKCCPRCDNAPFLDGYTLLASARKIRLFAEARWWEGMLRTDRDQCSLLRCIIGNPYRPVTLSETALEKSRCHACAGRGRRWETNGYTTRKCLTCSGSGQVEEKQHRPVSWLSWRGGLIPAMAEAIYQSRRWEDMPILADALHEAGCEEQAILEHLRGWQPCWHCVANGTCPVEPIGGICMTCGGIGRLPAPLHARGCHVLDLLTGRS